MEKAKIGLPVNLLCAAAYLLVLFGGYIPALLIVGYVMLCESNITLKVSAVTALAVALVFSALNAVVGLLPDIANVFTSLLNIFGAYVSLQFVYNLVDFVYNVLDLAKTIVMVLLAVMPLVGKPVELSFIKKHMI